MNISNDFTSGFIAENILSCLQRCSADTLMSLFRRGYLRLKEEELYRLSERSLTYKGLDAYSVATNVPVRYFFFGDGGNNEILTYTPYDKEVIDILDHIPQEQLAQVKNGIMAFYHNKGFYTEARTPNTRYYSCLRRLPRGATINVSVAEHKRYRLDVGQELQRFRTNHYSPNFLFVSDYWPDLATHIGVSLHWIFQLKTPLFCRTQEAEEIFDYYTLLQPEQQVEVLEILRGRCRQEV